MPYLKTKLKNDICRLLPAEDLRFRLSNICINGEKRGCSGHVTYLPTGRCIYVNTEPLLTNPRKIMFRFAKNEQDYTSSHSEFSAINLFTTQERLALDIYHHLTMPRAQIRSITRDTIQYP